MSLVALTLACCGIVAPVAAWAAPGDHIRAGDVEIVPDLDLGAEARTNVFRDETETTPAANFRISPGLQVRAEGDDHAFRGEGEWLLRKYFFVADDGISPQPTAERLGNLDRFDEFSLGVGADTFRRNMVGLKFSNDTALKNFRSDAEYADVPYTSQLRNAFTAGLRTNPGAALEITPGGIWTFDSFRVPSVNGSDRALNNRNTYGPNVAARWAFFPRTAVVGNASFLVNDWQNNALPGNPSEITGNEIALPNSNQIKAMAGIDGRFTDKLFAQASFGYGVGMFREQNIAAEDPLLAGADATGTDGLLVKAQLRYSITPTSGEKRGSSVAVGYIRDFLPSFFTNYIQLNQVFADFQGRVGDFVPSARYELRFENYHGELTRQDVVNRLAGDLRYVASDWVSVTTGAWWQQRASSEDTVEYDDVNLHLFGTFTY